MSDRPPPRPQDDPGSSGGSSPHSLPAGSGGYAAGPEPVVRATVEGGLGRAPALALFVGGFLSALGLVSILLAWSGIIRPGAPWLASPSAPAQASPSPAPSPAASPAPSAALASPTIAPIVAPAVLTPTDLADGHAVGEVNAPITVEIWEDYQCPYCRRFTEQVEPQLIADYVATGKVRLVFRDYAFLGSESAWAAVAARLAEQQGKFWPYHDYLFANQLGENVGSFSVPRLQAMADAVGLDRAAFDVGLQVTNAQALFGQIKAASDADASRLGVDATPSVVLDDKLLQGNDWATIKAAIDAALAAKK